MILAYNVKKWGMC